jgi:hypothetical protein
VGLKSLKSLNLTSGYPNKKKKNNKNNNKVKSKPLELFEGSSPCTARFKRYRRRQCRGTDLFYI